MVWAYTLDYYRLEDGDFIFQHDNDPKHTAKITTTYLKEEAKYPVLPWPSQSPDLNPIEHMWRHLKLKLALYEQRARGVHELWERIKIEWETFDKDICLNIVYKEQIPEVKLAGSLKRKETEEESSSEDRSWNSTELGGAKKYVKIYVSSTYAETDFGGSDDNKSSWLINDMNISNLLRDYRNEAIRGAQMRKILSNSRILMTYRMVSKKGQVMIPDFALYSDALTAINFELFVVEVKKPGNFSNGHLETDIVKLGVVEQCLIITDME
ncbi:hypothetical protein G6F16_011990 [Rhizopus arrhizus]|nr:hypothetical protein G6F16_011990 [Rhizopus arrhizus]